MPTLAQSIRFSLGMQKSGTNLIWSFVFLLVSLRLELIISVSINVDYNVYSSDVCRDIYYLLVGLSKSLNDILNNQETYPP